MRPKLDRNVEKVGVDNGFVRTSTIWENKKMGKKFDETCFQFFPNNVEIDFNVLGELVKSGIMC